MFTNDLNVAGSNLADSLNELMNKNVQKMQQREQLKQMLLGGQQGPSQSLNAGDFLRNLNPQNLIERSAGKTPLNIPQMQQPQLPAVQQPQLPSLAASTESRQDQQQPLRNESAADKKERLAREREERTLKGKRQLQVDKETFPYYDKIKKQAATTDEIDARLDQMEELLNTGKVQSGVTASIFDTLKNLPWFIGRLGGVIEQAFTSNESQIFKKLSQDFLRDAKPYFGSNLSTREVELFLERVPNLMQSTEGKRGVIRNFRALNEYTKAVDDIMEGVIAENGGERPRHLESKVHAKTKKAAEKLRQSFRDSVKMVKKMPGVNFTKQAYEKSKKRQLA